MFKKKDKKDSEKPKKDSKKSVEPSEEFKKKFLFGRKSK